MAIACLRLVTLPPCPFLPRFNVPFLRRFMARSTSLPALREYLAIARSPVKPRGSANAMRAEQAGYNRNGTFHTLARFPLREEAKRPRARGSQTHRGENDGLAQTGSQETVSDLVRARKAKLFRFADDGE